MACQSCVVFLARAFSEAVLSLCIFVHSHKYIHTYMSRSIYIRRAVVCVFLFFSSSASKSQSLHSLSFFLCSGPGCLTGVAGWSLSLTSIRDVTQLFFCFLVVFPPTRGIFQSPRLCSARERWEDWSRSRCCSCHCCVRESCTRTSSARRRMTCRWAKKKAPLLLVGRCCRPRCLLLLSILARGFVERCPR